MPVRFTHLDSGSVETTESFFSHQFLEARIASGLESNQGFDPILEEGRSEEWLERHASEIRSNGLRYEEDVNQYITLTLADLANPRCLDLMNQCLVGIDSDVGQVAQAVEERFKRYLLYKVNADFLLFHLGLFDPMSPVRGDAYFDKGGAYYYSAAASLKGMKGGRSALSDVFEKLAGEFGKYVHILRCLRSRAENYLSFHFRFSREDMEELERILRQELKKGQDPDRPFSV